MLPLHLAMHCMQDINMSQFKGKVLLVINVASACGALLLSFLQSFFGHQASAVLPPRAASHMPQG